MKRSKKLAKRAQQRKQRYDSKMNDPRISHIFKQGSNPPGSGKKS